MTKKPAQISNLVSNLKTKFPALLEISLGLNDQVKLKSALSENILEHFADCIFLKLIRLITCEHQFNMTSINKKRKLETQNQDSGQTDLTLQEDNIPETAGNGQSISSSAKFKKSTAGRSVKADQTDDGLSAGGKNSNDSKDQDDEVLVLSNGWKRQCVIRKSGKTAGLLDVYFYSPDGMKFRSRPEVVKYIKMKKLNLNIQEFDFSKKKIKDLSKDVNKKDKGKEKKAMLSKKYDFKRNLCKKKPSSRRGKGNKDECEVRSEDKEKAMFEKKPEEYSSNKSKVVKIDSKKTTEDIEVEEESLGNNKEKAVFEKKPKEYSSNKSKVVKIDSKKTKEDIEVEEESLGNNPTDDSKENGSEKTYPNRKGQDRHECELKSANEKEGYEEMAEDASNDSESGTGNTKDKGIQFHVDCEDKCIQVDLEEFREVNEDVKTKDERNESKSSPQNLSSVIQPVEEEENDENVPEEKFQLMAIIKRRYRK
ncbi:hypothetical protein CDAR_525212 [Caerostris darwini]|uniref:MBD domain-containing protein n=1 Tax=Caerostris darwini TaxID=1538125 RepID=A0AAV4Q143_9ARAC|nr:hypothetical protein CDAR_525212 [Caerostris darwini]